MKRFIAIAALTLTLGACSSARDYRMGEGALIGGAGGAVIGGIASNSVGGAVVGGLAGAAVGAVVADVTRPRYRRSTRCHYSEMQGRRVCRYR